MVGTYDQPLIGTWHLRHFLTLLTISDNVLKTFWFSKKTDFLNIFRFSEKFQIFRKISELEIIFRLLDFSQLFFNLFSTFSQFFSFIFFNLWHLRLWLQYWQLRTWNHDNLCYLTINCDTGQHSQFLRCFCR